MEISRLRLWHSTWRPAAQNECLLFIYTSSHLFTFWCIKWSNGTHSWQCKWWLGFTARLPQRLFCGGFRQVPCNLFQMTVIREFAISAFLTSWDLCPSLANRGNSPSSVLIHCSVWWGQLISLFVCFWVLVMPVVERHLRRTLKGSN